MSDIVEVKFISIEDIRENSSVTRNVEAEAVYPWLDLAQRVWILPILTYRLYTALSDDILANGLTGATIEHQNLIRAIKPALIYATASEAMPFLRTKITNKGIVFKSSDSQSEVANEKAVGELKQAYAYAAQTYIQDLKRFLRINHASYPLWTEEYYATHEQHSGATYSNGTSEYFSGIVFDRDISTNNKLRKFY